MAEPILEIENLGISFFTRAGEIPAVMDFSCKVMPGEAMGLVGESGCGKSTVALAVMRDLPGVGRITGGAIRFEGRDMATLSGAELRAIRGSTIAMVYQEPMASLNPTMLIGRQLMEVPLIHERVSKEEARARALDMVKAVRLPDPERVMRAYPHQLSGGQQQRVVIAMALLSNPRLLILDEPTTALDVTVEAGIVALVKDLTARTGASSLFISHNLGLILETCNSVTVMYSGEAVETGRVRDVFGAVRHPYTQGLFRSMALPGTNKNDNPLIPIPGQLPLPHERPQGCNFGPRCTHFVSGLCDRADVPMLDVAGHPGHQSRCLRVEAIDWAASARKGERLAPVRIGADVLDGRPAEEALSGRRERAVRQRRGAHGQGRRGRFLRRPRSGGPGDRRRVGLRQVDARQGAARTRDGERGARGVRRRGDPEPAGRASRGRHDRLDPDDLPESVRHAQSELHGRLADPAHARAVPRSARAAPSGARPC